MGSFYGSGVICGESSSGTSDYNKLDNTPIINLHGIEPLDLSSLEVGLYKVSGNYKYSADAETNTFLHPELIQVFSDRITASKMVRFDLYESGQRYTQTVIYKDSNTYSIERYAYNNLAVNNFSNLPPIGDMTKIYTTPDGLYVWDGQEYQKLGSPSDPSWGEF